MLKTPLGAIKIKINDKPFLYSCFDFPRRSTNFCVDGRYGIILERIEKGTQVWIELAFDECTRVKKNVESGERLSLISFEEDTIKVSIGAIGDIPKVLCQYLDNGLYFHFGQAMSKFPIIVSWKRIGDEKDGIHTWLASDPASIGGKGFENRY